jgi:hypothetical protein
MPPRPLASSRHRLFSRSALMAVLVLTLVTTGCSSGAGTTASAAPSASASPQRDDAATTDAPSPDVVPRSTLGSTSSDPACTLGASSPSCHGWVNTLVEAGTVPFVQSMTCTYNVPEKPTASASTATSEYPEVLYLYCQIVGGGENADEFGQLAPQIAFGADFDVCGQPRPSALYEWYMQAMYFWKAPSATKGQCVGGEIFEVEVGATITSTIEWVPAQQWWQLSITDGTNTSTQTVEAPQAPDGQNATMNWSDFTVIVPGGSFEMWNGTEVGDYPADDWNMTTSFEQLPDTPIDPSYLQMVWAGDSTNATSVSCDAQSACTWSPPS